MPTEGRSKRRRRRRTSSSWSRSSSSSSSSSSRMMAMAMAMMMVMEQLAVTLLLVCSLMIVRVDSVASPNDIISGQEFLSILMKPGPAGTAVGGDGSSKVASVPLAVAATEQPPRNRGLRKFRHFFYGGQAAVDGGEDEETILPIEALFAGGTPTDGRSEQMERNIGPYGRSAARNLKLLPSSTTTTTTTTMRPSVRWLPVSVSSTTTTTTAQPAVMSEEQTIGPEGITEITTEAIATTTEVPGLPEPEETKEPEPAHHSNSHRSELSVEEVAPMVSKQQQQQHEKEKPDVLVDVEEEVEKQEQDRKFGRIGQRTERARSAGSQHRTERKQESQGSQQTVIYHDKKSDTGGSGGSGAQKSVSYSFIGESAPTLKTWRDLNAEYLPEQTTVAGATTTTTMTSLAFQPRSPEPATAHSYSQPARFYSEPAQFYSEPARIYSEPARIYGEPEKVYSEPARVYSQPARVYSEPAKVYSQPSSYWQTAYSMPRATGDTATTEPTDSSTTTTTTTTTTTVTVATQADDAEQRNRQRLVFNELDKIPYDQLNAPVDGDERITLHNAIGKFVPKQQVTGQNGQQPAAVQPLPPVAGATGADGDAKIGYVVEGRNYRKYRVEEKTPDGFIVGEYGVLSHNDGNLRGVRYTADSDINPRLIYDALLKFLSL
ncbi:uncharacterized protein LOC125955772 isoform X2 [Anopheles darlingi]|uniref:uncharacterized protein LOC125955772 isoform X2 n=1 Tax=Anopheles darlingi TaxID=43151 RepID=UPI0020FFFF96|nr:uncharacterized protein LOC125955772 isoform X2 [Anopheles darlingi]